MTLFHHKRFMDSPSTFTFILPLKIYPSKWIQPFGHTLLKKQQKPWSCKLLSHVLSAMSYYKRNSVISPPTVWRHQIKVTEGQEQVGCEFVPPSKIRAIIFTTLHTAGSPIFSHFLTIKKNTDWENRMPWSHLVDHQIECWRGTLTHSGKCLKKHSNVTEAMECSQSGGWQDSN